MSYPRGARKTKSPMDDFEDLAMDEARRVPTKGEIRGVEKRSSRRSQVAVALSLLIALFSLIFGVWNTAGIAQNAAQQTINEKDIKDLREANRLRKKQGLPPIPLPPPGEPVDVKSVASAAAAMALEDIKNNPEFQGPPGPRGAPCLPSVPGCTGQGGQDGQRGPQGQEGPPGVNGRGPTDSQIGQAVSIYCSQASRPCVGDQGPEGPEGPKGEDSSVPGPQGPQGPPPAVFTFTVPATLTSPERNYVCSPEPPGSTNFVCTEG